MINVLLYYTSKYSLPYIFLMKSQGKQLRYWCHDCRQQFKSMHQPGDDTIACGACKGDFCQLLTPQSKPQYFQPYQKEPQKKKRHIVSVQNRAVPINIHQLHQILQQQTRQKEGIQLSKQQLQGYAKQLDKESECSVCRQDLEKGSKHPVFECKHAFHLECLIQWLKIKNSCPTCRNRMVLQ